MKYIKILKSIDEESLILDDLYDSKDKDNLIIAKEIEKSKNIVYIDKSTIKVLEFLSLYYKYVGVRELTPHHKKKNDIYLYPHHGDFILHSLVGEPLDVNCKDRKNPKSGFIMDSPAIWRAAEMLNIRSCGNSHQYQIGKELTSGLYKNIKGEWYKQIKTK